jgi:hypothetical protein
MRLHKFCELKNVAVMNIRNTSDMFENVGQALLLDLADDHAIIGLTDDWLAGEPIQSGVLQKKHEI